jgi:hypothetical protein
MDSLDLFVHLTGNGLKRADFFVKTCADHPAVMAAAKRRLRA